jgi:uncharacterized protein YkwD
MKKKKNIILCISMCVLLAGCGQTQAEDTFSPTIAENDLIAQTESEMQTLTQLLTEAVTQPEAQTETTENPTQEVTKGSAPEEVTVQITESPTQKPTQEITEIQTEITESPTQEATKGSAPEETTVQATESPTQMPTQEVTEAQTLAPETTEAQTQEVELDMDTRIAMYMETYAGYIQEVLRLVNEARAANGLSALQYDETLCKVATYRSIENVDNDMFSHTRPDGSNCFTLYAEYGLSYHAAAENIAYGYSTPQAVVNGWLNSPGHYKNIMGDYTHLGIGVVPDSFGQLMWTQNFIAY